MTLHITLTRH